MKLITEKGTFDLEAMQVAATELPTLIDWELKPEGLCRGEICVIWRDAPSTGEPVDLVAVAEALRAPLVVDAEADAAVFGTPAEVRASEAAGMQVGDFKLHDVDGNPFRWSSLGRKKKLMFAWASW